jgi:pilus assembly protein CpaF
LSVTLRRYTVREASLQHLIARDALSPEAAAFLHAVMQVRTRVAISGEPGAGKTTLLAALLAAVPAAHCVRCCEEIREISVPVARRTTKCARRISTVVADQRDLVKFVLAMRPDVIVVGGARRAFELIAVNAGCGFLCRARQHGEQAVNALVGTALMAGENVTVRKVFRGPRSGGPADATTSRASRARIRRRVMEITAVAPTLSADQTYEPIFVRERLGRPLEWTGALPGALEQRVDRVPSRTRLRSMLDRSPGGRP